MQWVWISSPHNPHSITKYIQALAPSNNWLVVKDLIADRAVIIGQGGSLGWTLYNCINGCCYAVYQADMRGTLPATVHFHPEREEWIRDGGETDRDKTSAVKLSIGSITGCIITEKAPTRAFSWLKAIKTLG